MMVVGFWTAGTPYEAEAVELVKTLKAFGLAHDVREYPHPGNWAKANLMTPAVIRAGRQRYPGQTLLYLDADARMRRPLTDALRHFERSTDDVGLYFLPKAPRCPDGTGFELCSGTTIWKDTIAANTLLDAWCKVCALPESENLRGLDQEALQCLLPSQSYVKVWRLPHEWCWIDAISPDRITGVDPVIYHTQASRRLRRAVNHCPASV